MRGIIISTSSSCGNARSIKLKDARHGGASINGTTSQYLDIVQRMCFTFAVRVTAEHGQLSFGMFAYDVENRVTHRFAGEMRSPVVVRKSTCVPAGFTQWWDVREENNMPVAGERFRQDLANMSRRFIAQP